MFAVTALAAGAALVLTGAMAGVFFAFSVSVLRGLDAIEAAQAVAAMRSINRRILNPVFLTAFTGAPLAALATGGLLLARGETPAAMCAFAAAGAYLLGAFAPTVAVNVPLNEDLDAAPGPYGPQQAARLWAAY